MDLSFPNTDRVESLMGKLVTYTFDNRGDEDLIYSISDGYQRSKRFNRYVKEEGEDDLELDIENGKISFTFCLDGYETLDELREEWDNLVNKLNRDIIDDDRCLTNCGYYRGPDGFCSIHSNLNPDDYRKSHSDYLKEKIRDTLDAIREFCEEPLPNTFTEKYYGKDGDVDIDFSLTVNY
jgi:hypothetical protein